MVENQLQLHRMFARGVENYFWPAFLGELEVDAVRCEIGHVVGGIIGDVVR